MRSNYSVEVSLLDNFLCLVLASALVFIFVLLGVSLTLAVVVNVVILFLYFIFHVVPVDLHVLGGALFLHLHLLGLGDKLLSIVLLFGQLLLVALDLFGLFIFIAVRLLLLIRTFRHRKLNLFLLRLFAYFNLLSLFSHFSVFRLLYFALFFSLCFFFLRAFILTIIIYVVKEDLGDTVEILHVFLVEMTTSFDFVIEVDCLFNISFQDRDAFEHQSKASGKESLDAFDVSLEVELGV